MEAVGKGRSAAELRTDEAAARSLFVVVAV